MYGRYMSVVIFIMNEHNLVQVTKILHVQTEQKLLKREKGSLEEEELKTSFGKKKEGNLENR